MWSPQVINFKLRNGEIFGVFFDNLMKYPDTYLSTMVSHESAGHFKSTNEQGQFVVDEDPDIFKSILQFYRRDCFQLPKQYRMIKERIIQKYLLPCNACDSLSGNFHYIAIEEQDGQDIGYHVANDDKSYLSSYCRVTPDLKDEINGVKCIGNCLYQAHYVDIINYLFKCGDAIEKIKFKPSASITMKKKV
ncbi:unnamed protein product [Didymodactylos carnosus]|uniref:Potassium channel tetramerisation-type BTB domain-containing protein n=1 Tax=Didymodactylos carnosus TaxID=1234261 RepID=A0A814KZN9_9BILA|nr:unnamed protein product [Didymodactylos carnosus]CAF1058130.1 unnamed protein product [Didymodactylos carnosus]CAF3676483.1 unnamed protein product [Didymodactylos carnosus]CAF3826851.1 unnamed protein product [Didymodactylos carnosus]